MRTLAQNAADIEARLQPPSKRVASRGADMT